MTLKLALCFAAAAVSLPAPATALADDSLVSISRASDASAALRQIAFEPPRSSPPFQVRSFDAASDSVLVTPALEERAAPDKPPAGPAAELYATGEPLIEWPGEAGIASEHEDLWDRIRAGFAMSEVDSTLVQRHEAWYLNRPEYVARMIDRSRRYLYHIVEEVEKRGMPTEIALLPMIESAFNPTAYSHMRAAGMWQFMPYTGKRYGLQQTWWYDGRRDVMAATRAALDYLQMLHDMFGDWELALAAYNCGEGAVQRAMEKNRRKGLPTDYLSLQLPKETRNYLPKLQAVKNIVADPELFHLALAPLPNSPYFAVVTAPATIDMAVAARLAGVPLEEFRDLNPGHQRPVITPTANRQLLVPVDKVALFNANLESNEQPLVTWQTYQIKKGERLDTVSRKFNIDVERLKQVNGLTGRRGLRPGQMLLVPMGDDAETNLDETYRSKDFQAPVEDYHKRVVYRVKPGDNLTSIARRYHVSVQQLKSWNGMTANAVHKGQRITVWQASAGRTVKTTKSGAHKAKAPQREVRSKKKVAAPQTTASR
jgi:membrane-bound lytic murein transglycosylase D